MAEICAAVLFGQLEEFEVLQKTREENWRHYKQSLTGYTDAFSILESPEKEIAHMFAIVVRSEEEREYFRSSLQNLGVYTTSHYEPLNQSTAGKKFGRSHTECKNATGLSKTILRMPLWTKPRRNEIDFIGHSIGKLIDGGQ